MPSLQRKFEEIDEVLDKLHGGGYITDWEREFIESFHDRVGPLASLSPRQEAALNAIYKKACNSPF